MSDHFMSALKSIAKELRERKQEIIDANVSLGFTYSSSATQIDRTAEGLEKFESHIAAFRTRKGVCQGDDAVVYLLPYNYSAMICTMLAGQMALGNRVIAKPSELAQRSGKILGDIMTKYFPGKLEFDYRPGAEFMNWAIEEPNVKVIILYGSHLVARSYLRKVKQYGKRFIFEGPGKNPFIVLDGVNIPSAVGALTGGKYQASGQRCFSPGKLYIQDGVFDDFMELLVEVTRKVNFGAASDPDTTVGPIGSPLGVKRITEQLEDARAKGAKILTGGVFDSNLIAPTIITNTNESMTGMKAESFGPILWVVKFKTTEDAIRLAQDNEFGLAATVCGGENASVVADAIRGPEYLHEVPDFVFGKYGMVSVNPEGDVMTFGGPSRSRGSGPPPQMRGFGGYGYSGWVCDTVNGRFRFMQGPKNMEVEASVPVTGEVLASYLN
ncbi:MAG: aldehyde dehydrogenase family protein [Chloroflexi bacterium]|nr:aldehyde dehydrogenase family protein [Chloroflexota bacterium]